MFARTFLNFFGSTGVSLHLTSHLCRRSTASEGRTRVVGSSSRVRRKRRQFPGLWWEGEKERMFTCVQDILLKTVAKIPPLSHYTPASLGSSHTSASVCHLSSEAARWLDLPELAPALTRPRLICCPLLDQLKLCRVWFDATVGGSQSTVPEVALMRSSRPGDKHFTADGFIV